MDDPQVEPAPDPEPEAPRPKLTDLEPLSVIQDRLRKETAAGVRGGKVRRGRQM